MKTLILSDIHSNLQALKAVLDDAQSWDQVIFLGDVANFGPNPSECIKILREINAISVIGNHDVIISQKRAQKDINQFDKWSRKMISPEDKKWLRSLPETLSFQCDGKIILLVHGAYDVDYDILPGISDDMIKGAFCNQISDPVDEIWFGHYHYQIDREIDGISYHCIRPVGHHRDHDTRAGYSVYENGVMTHHRVAYDIEQTISNTLLKMTFLEEPLKSQWIELLRCAYQKELLKKDLKTMDSY